MMSRVLVFVLLTSTAWADPIACIRAGVEHVFVDTGEYVLTETLSIPSNVTIYCAPNVTFIAASGAFKGIHDSLVEIKGTNNAIQNCSFKMLREMYTEANGYPSSEWRHGLSLVGATNIRLDEIFVIDSGGDGVFIGPRIDGPYSEDRHPSERITIDRLTATGNYRNGLAITSCVNCTVRNSTFENTIGTSPSAGFIIEPDHGGDRALVVVERCVSKNNAGSAFFVQMKKQNQNSQPISVTFKDCVGMGIPHGHTLIRVDNFNKNEIPVKPAGKICWNDSCWP